MNMKKSYGFDKQKAEKGVWITLDEGGKVLLAKIGSHAYDLAIAKHTRDYQSKIRLGKLTTEDMKKISILVEAETVLLNWEGLEEEPGKPLPYSRENAIYVLTEYPEFRAEIVEYANDRSRFQSQDFDEETDAKN
jgi:hypothetical protein